MYANTFCICIYCCIIFVQWSLFGNRILPRDVLLAFAENAVKAAEGSDKDNSRSFSDYWKVSDFEEIKEEYERMLKTIPEERCIKWKEAVGLVEKM